MAFESEFLDMMPDTISVNLASTALTGYGKVQHSTAAKSYSALVQYDQKLIRAMDGTEKVSTTQALIACSSRALSPADKFTLPSGTAPVVLSVANVSDDEGQHHVEVHFG